MAVGSSARYNLLRLGTGGLPLHPECLCACGNGGSILHLTEVIGRLACLPAGLHAAAGRCGARVSTLGQHAECVFHTLMGVSGVRLCQCQCQCVWCASVSVSVCLVCVCVSVSVCGVRVV